MPAPIVYAENKTAVTGDVVISGIIAAFVVLVGATLIISPSLKLTSKRAVGKEFSIIGGIIVGCIILVNLFAFDWASATISTETEYTAFLSSAIHATVGLHIGLHGINITLLGEPKHQVNQTIDYNENFPWSFAQGRLGFSPDDGSFFNVRFRAAQVRGTPLPILNVAEYFTLDGEKIRWGRFYRIAGLYTQLTLWIAFSFWVLTCLLFAFVPSNRVVALSGALCTGLTLIAANLVYYGMVKQIAGAFPDLQIPFPDAVLTPTWGWTFYLNLVTGILVTVLSLLAIFLFKRSRSRHLRRDPLQEKETNRKLSHVEVEARNAALESAADILKSLLPSHPVDSPPGHGSEFGGDAQSQSQSMTSSGSPGEDDDITPMMMSAAPKRSRTCDGAEHEHTALAEEDAFDRSAPFRFTTDDDRIDEMEIAWTPLVSARMSIDSSSAY